MKRFITYTAVFFIGLSAQQVSAQRGWNVSINANPHFSWMLNKDDNQSEDFDRRSTINTAFGVGVGYNFSHRAGLGLGVLYSLQGQKYKLEDEQLNQRMNYFKLPLTFNYVFNPRSKVALVGKVGPQLSILAASRVKDADGKTVIDNSKEYFKDVTFGGAAGLSTQFNLGKQWFLTTGLRYDFDFTNAEDEKHPDFTQGRKKTHNMTAGLEIGLKYSFH
ncbi:MAG TPA: porin family protein [Flavisolibacter sp.]|jgi:hypothetical protein|nr:porin family protein [Flavisolibacter sp.]